VSSVKVGEKVPTIEMSGTGGLNVKVPNGQKMILFIYPKDNTPGCTQEAHEFSALKSEFNSLGVQVFGVSRDSVQSHEGFKAQQNYSVDLLSDGQEQVCGLLGVMKMKNMYGKMVRGVERSTFYISEDGTLLREWRGVNVPGHALEVLNFVKGS